MNRNIINQISDTSSENLQNMFAGPFDRKASLPYTCRKLISTILERSKTFLHLGDLRQFTGAKLVRCSHAVGGSQ